MEEIYVVMYFNHHGWNYSDDGDSEDYVEPKAAYRKLNEAIDALSKVYIEELQNEDACDVEFKEDGLNSYVTSEMKNQDDMWAWSEWIINKVKLN